jgi:hypothetical protein
MRKPVPGRLFVWVKRLSWLELAIFAALGIGMALPVLALSFFPSLLRRLPRPGAWMETFKQVLAFPLYATVAWLAWVLGAQSGNDAVFALLGGLVLVAMGAWMYGRSEHAPGLWRTVLAILFAGAGLVVAWPGHTVGDAGLSPVAQAGELAWEPWSPGRGCQKLLGRFGSSGTSMNAPSHAAWARYLSSRPGMNFSPTAASSVGGPSQSPPNTPPSGEGSSDARDAASGVAIECRPMKGLPGMRALKGAAGAIRDFSAQCERRLSVDLRRSKGDGHNSRCASRLRAAADRTLHRRTTSKGTTP